MADDNVEYRIGQLEGDVSELKTDVKKILTNDLPHIDSKLAVLSDRSKLTLWVGSVFFTILIGLGIASLS